MRDRRLGLFYCLPGVALAVALTGCGGGGSSPSPSGPVPTVTATPSPIAHPTTTPSPVPAPSATAVPSGSAVTEPVVPGQPISLPGVGGFVLALTFNAPPGITFPAGFTVTAQSYAGAVSTTEARHHALFTPPSGVLASVEFSFDDATTIAYSLTTTVPGTDTTGVSYTADTFDSTTGTLIASIVATASGGSATFTDPTPFAVVAKHEYVTDIFLTPVVATATPTAGPIVTPVPTATPSSPPLQLFAANNPGGGVAEYNGATGSLTRTFATSLTVGTVGADNAGNIYTFGGGGASSELSKLAVGGSAPLASYAPTSSQPLTMSVAPGGEMVVLGISGNDAVFDEWDPGKTGAPSRTITYAETNGIEATFAQDADGNLYVPYTTSSGAQKFDVLRADSSSLLRTLTESLASNASPFSPSVMAAGTDGTLYVGEWTYSSSDPNAAMYVFSPSGAETKVASMAPGIVGIDFDSAGNVYVASDNTVYNGSGNSQTDDTAEQLTTYSAHAAALMHQINDGAPGVGALTVGDDGTAYLVEFASFAGNGPVAAGAVYTVAPGGSSSTPLIPSVTTNNVVLYTGSDAKDLRMGRVFHTNVGQAASAARARMLRRK